MSEAWDASLLEAALTGSLAPFRERLLIGARPPGRFVPAAELMTPAHLDLVHRHFNAAHGATERRVVASIWSKWHFAVVMPAWFIGRVVLRRRLPLAWHEVAFGLDAEGRTTSLGVAVPGIGDGADEAAALPVDTSWPDFMHHHLTPCMVQLAERTGVTRRVLWNNAGNLFESFLQRLDQTHPGSAGLAPARRLLETPTLADGRPNPMFQPVFYRQGNGGEQRVRRICCMRYLVPDRVFCTTCPSPLRDVSNSACAPAAPSPLAKIAP